MDQIDVSVLGTVQKLRRQREGGVSESDYLRYIYVDKKGGGGSANGWK